MAYRTVLPVQRWLCATCEHEFAQTLSVRPIFIGPGTPQRKSCGTAGASARPALCWVVGIVFALVGPFYANWGREICHSLKRYRTFHPALYSAELANGGFECFGRPRSS